MIYYQCVDYKEYFVPFAQDVDKFLRDFFARKKEEASKISPVAFVVWKNLEKFIKGGKRLRAGLVKLGYETYGGRNFKSILPVAAAYELTHGSILVHDDIIDQDTLRHNKPTIHKVYEKFHRKNYRKGESVRYGESMAICVGDAGLYEAISLIAESNFRSHLKIGAIERLTQTMSNTVYGEALDVDLGCRDKIAEKLVNSINTLKTSYYTFVGPLKIGAILAGAGQNRLGVLEEYGLPLGLAFQIQDDILGMFGDVKKFGKSIDSDIRQGKNTLLFTQSLKRATPAQKRLLKRYWGKSDITKKEAGLVRKIIIDSGSLDYSKRASLDFIEEAKGVVDRITQDPGLGEVYSSLADYIAKRER